MASCSSAARRAAATVAKRLYGTVRAAKAVAGGTDPDTAASVSAGAAGWGVAEVAGESSHSAGVGVGTTGSDWSVG